MNSARLRQLGIVGSIAALTALVAGFSWQNLDVITGPRFSAAFAEAGGLSKGDEVIASGLVIGEVTSVELQGSHVRVEFKVSDSDVRLGRTTSAAIVSQTVLGRRALSVDPAGPGRLTAEIPLSRTRSPYALEDALGDLSTSSERIEVEQLAEAMTGTGRILEETAPDLQPLLDSLYRVAELVNGRGSDLHRLLASTAGVSEVLAERDLQIRSLIADSGSLLTTVDKRKVALEDLLVDATRVTRQLQELLSENRQQFGPAFDELNQLLELLVQHRRELTDGVQSAAPVLRNLGEVVAAFPGFSTWITNLVATNLVPTLPELLGGTSQP